MAARHCGSRYLIPWEALRIVVEFPSLIGNHGALSHQLTAHHSGRRIGGFNSTPLLALHMGWARSPGQERGSGSVPGFEVHRCLWVWRRAAGGVGRHHQGRILRAVQLWWGRETVKRNSPGSRPRPFIGSVEWDSSFEAIPLND